MRYVRRLEFVSSMNRAELCDECDSPRLTAWDLKILKRLGKRQEEESTPEDDHAADTTTPSNSPSERTVQVDKANRPRKSTQQACKAVVHKAVQKQCVRGNAGRPSRIDKAKRPRKSTQQACKAVVHKDVQKQCVRGNAGRPSRIDKSSDFLHPASEINSCSNPHKILSRVVFVSEFNMSDEFSWD